ncbi:MAG: SGNH/GDSL hydrolase family protein [Thermodesulfobacteriota bacterium]
MNKGRKIVLLILSGIFLSLPVIEGMSWLYLWNSRRATGPSIHDYFYIDSNGVSRFRPGVSGWHIGYDNFPVTIQINSKGFRGPEIRESPERRIVFIGDSIVFDGGVKQEKTFISLTEKLFREEGVDVEIVNAGTTDVGVDQYLLQVKSDRIQALDPDVIVVGLYLNDSRPPQGHLGEKHMLQKILDMPVVRDLAMRQLIIEKYINIKLKLNQISTQRFDWVQRFLSGRWRTDLSQFKQMVQEARYDWGAAWELSFDDVVFPALREIRDLCLKNGITMALVLFPVGPQVYTEFEDPYIDYPQARLLEFAKRERLSVLDLLLILRTYRHEPLFTDHAHLNQKGNEVVAYSIFPFLKEILNSQDEYY